MTDSKIEAAVPPPFAQGRGASNQVTRFAGNRSATVTADDVRSHPGLHRQLNCLCKITRGDLNLVPTREKLRDQRAKERHVGRVS